MKSSSNLTLPKSSHFITSDKYFENYSVIYLIMTIEIQFIRLNPLLILLITNFYIKESKFFFHIRWYQTDRVFYIIPKLKFKQKPSFVHVN